MRVVIDTSTLVGAVMHADSIPHRVWLHAQRTCEVLAILETFAEIETVLHRDRLSRFIDSKARDQFLSLYRATVEWVALDASQIAAFDDCCRDPRDTVFLALARIGDAQLIISSDKDLLSLHPWRGVAILTPAKFINQLGKDFSS